MICHDGLVQAIVRQQVLGDSPFTEALQAGRIGLWRAILGFDPLRGLAFSTYAWPCIMRQVWRAVKAHARFARPRECCPEWPVTPCLAPGFVAARAPCDCAAAPQCAYVDFSSSPQ